MFAMTLIGSDIAILRRPCRLTSIIIKMDGIESYGMRLGKVFG